MSTFLIVLIVIAAIAGLAIATCPDTDSHKAALTNVISAAVNDEANSSDSASGSDDAIDKMFRQISDSWTQRVIATAVDNLIHVDNHIFYSTGKVRYDGKDHTVSVGAFGHVFTVDKEDIKAVAEQYYTKAERETKEDIRKKRREDYQRQRHRPGSPGHQGDGQRSNERHNPGHWHHRRLKRSAG